MHTIDTARTSAQLLDQLRGTLSGSLPDDQKKEKARAIGKKIFEILHPISLNDGDLFRQADALKNATELTEYTDLGLVIETANVMQGILHGIDPTIAPPKESTPSQHTDVVTHNVRLASMLITQLPLIIANTSLSEEEKRAKLVVSEKKILSAMRGANLPNSNSLLIKVEDLIRATEHPYTTLADIGAMAKTVQGLLQTIEQAARTQKNSHTLEKAAPRHDEARILHRPEVARIIESFPCPGIAAKIQLKQKTFAQAKELAYRIFSGIYGEELRERLHYSLFSQDDLLLFLLLDGVLHGADLKAVEIFTNIPEAGLSAIQALQGQLTKEAIIETLLGKSEKTKLPEGMLWTKAVSQAYLANNAWANALLAHMNAFRLPTPEQLLHIALEVPGQDVRESLRRAVEAEDPEAFKELETLLAIHDETNDERAHYIAKELLLHPLLPQLLTTMATDRPEFVMSVADAFALLPEEALVSLDETMISSLAHQYLNVVRNAMHSASTREGIDRACAFLTGVVSVPMRVAAKAGFIKAFRDTHPLDAIKAILSIYGGDDGVPSPCIEADINPSQGIHIFTKNKSVQEALQYAPHMESNPKVLSTLFLDVMLRSINTDIEAALQLFDTYPKMQNEDVIWPLARHLGAHGTVATLHRLLSHPSLAKYRDLLRSEFVLTVLEHRREGVRTEEVLAIMGDMEDAQTLSTVCDKAVFRFDSFDYVSISREDKAAVATLIAKAPSQARDLARCFCALGYMRSGGEEEMQEAYALVAEIQDTWWKEVALLEMCQELLRMRPEPSQAFASHSAHTLINLLDGCDGEDVDTIRSLLVHLLSPSSNSRQALELVRTIKSPRDLAHALRVLAVAIVTTHADHYLEQLHDLVRLACDQPDAVKHCLKAVLRPVASAEKNTALGLLKRVPENYMTIAEGIIFQAEEPSESASSNSDAE